MSQPVSVVEAKDTVLEVDSKDTIQFGSFAANYDKSLSDELNASGRATFISNNNIGYFCQSGDFIELAKIVKGLDLKSIRVIGNQSKLVYLAKYQKKIFIKKILNILEKETQE